MFKKLVAKPKDRMPDPFAFAHPMPPGSVIVSGVESSNELAHTDTSTASHILPPSDRSKADCHLSTFVALSPQYRLSIQAGTALGEAQVERWDEVLLNQGDVLIMVSTARHHGLPPPTPPPRHARGPMAPSLWEKTVVAVWRIRSLHLSRTEAQYLTPHLVEGVPGEYVWATMQ